jgi:hypothetical protein
MLDSFAQLLQAQGHWEEARGLYEQALLRAREVGDRRYEGITLANLAGLARQRTGDLEAGERLAAQSEALLTELGEKLELGKLLCVRGHLALARAESASDLLRRTAALAGEVGARPESELGQTLARLARAQAAFEAGETLFRGERWEVIPLSARRWLVESGQLSREQAGLL